MIEDSKEKSDEELVSISVEDSENFYFLMQRYEKKLLHYLRRMLNVNIHEAEDVLQEVFIKTYSNLNEFDSSLKFSSWIYRIAHNEAIDFYRKNQKNSQQDINIDDDYDSDLLEIAKNALDAKDLFIKDELKNSIDEILKTMPEDFREILVLRFLEEKDYTEISDILKKPLGTVSVFLSRAKKMFKEKALKLNLDITI